MSQHTEGRRANMVDSHVGGRVRMRRKLMGIRQDQLAEAIGLTFQQVQKYERGANRISASKLYDIAEVLGVEMGFFFDGLPDPVGGEAIDEAGLTLDRTVRTFLDTPEGLELASIFPQIARGKVRRQILDLVRTMADEMDGERKMDSAKG
jgi:transcriptional regulator with XRE-family HTH domain